MTCSGIWILINLLKLKQPPQIWLHLILIELHVMALDNAGNIAQKRKELLLNQFAIDSTAIPFLSLKSI